MVATHAITIDAEPADVGPCLAQMGSGRAGWYSWDIVDDARHASARAIEPMLQYIRRRAMPQSLKRVR